MKKVLAAALFCAVSSFATWDLFPAQPAGKGEAKLGFSYFSMDKLSQMGLNLGARYSIIDGLEAAVMLDNIPAGYVLTCSYDGKDCDEVGLGKHTGLNQPVVGVRYWLPMGLGIAADVIIPAGGKDLVGDEPQLGLNAGVQFSTKINDQLAIGSEAILSVIDKESKDYSNGMGLNVGLEADYSLGAVTPYLGIDLHQGLTKGDGEEAAKLMLGLDVGVTYDISESMYAQVDFWTNIIQDKDTMGDKKPMVITISYGLKF
jgi:hypothetical protein